MPTIDDIQQLLGLLAQRVGRLMIAKGEGDLEQAVRLLAPDMRTVVRWVQCVYLLGEVRSRRGDDAAVNASDADPRDEYGSLRAARDLTQYARRRSVASVNGADADEIVADLAAVIIGEAEANPAWQAPAPKQRDHHHDDGIHHDQQHERHEHARERVERIEQPAKRTKRRPVVGGKKAVYRANMRAADLRTLQWAAQRKLIVLPDLERVFRGRDVSDPEAVSAAELGQAIRLTLDNKQRIEQARTAFGLGMRKPWTTRSGRPYCCRIRSIDPYDATPEERRKSYNNAAATARRERRSAEPAATKQPMMENDMQTTTIPQQHPERGISSYRKAVLAQKAVTKAQFGALLDGLAAGEATIAQLMDAVRDHRSWRALLGDRRRFRQTVYDRLNALRAGGVITERHDARGPRGSKLRLVRLAKPRTRSTAEASAASLEDDEIPF